MKKIDISKIKLVYSNKPGTGVEIHAHVGQEVPCIEFTMREGVPQPITWTPDKPVYIYSEPWIQFPPEEWKNMIQNIHKKLVELWNRHYGLDQESTEIKNPKGHIRAESPGGKVHFASRRMVGIWKTNKVDPYCNSRTWGGDRCGKVWEITDKPVSCKNCISAAKKAKE